MTFGSFPIPKQLTIREKFSSLFKKKESLPTQKQYKHAMMVRRLYEFENRTTSITLGKPSNDQEQYNHLEYANDIFRRYKITSRDWAGPK